MGHVEVDPDAVAGTGTRIETAGHLAPAPPVSVSPAAPDPVSTAVAQTFAARMTAVTGYSAAGAAIAASRGAMVTASGARYQVQEAANTSAVGGSAAPAVETSTLPAASPPALPSPSVPAPAIATPPADGKTIATLIHTGPGTAGLHTAAAAIRGHSADLRAVAERLRSQANSLEAAWDSPAGREAHSRITELGAWYESHAGHAASLAAAIEEHGHDYGRARAAVPRPERFDEVQRRLQAAVAANQAPGSFGRYTPIIVELQSELARLHGQAVSGYAEYAANAGKPGVTGDPLEPPPHPGVQAVGYDVPLSPPPADPPHGKDPRYWIDVSKIIHVPDGQLAPYGTVQIGPGLYYPDPGGLNVAPPLPPAKYPLDIGDIVSRAPGQLGPNGHVEIARTPEGSYWAPDPGAGHQPSPPWSAPQRPVDVRDVIPVPAGQLAPWGYIEYLPGWFVPGPQLTNTPTIPAPR